MRTPTRKSRFVRRLSILALFVLLAACGRDGPPQRLVLTGSREPAVSAVNPTLGPAIAQRRAAVALWDATVLWDATETWNAAVADNERRAATPSSKIEVPRSKDHGSAPPNVSPSSGRCGGDLPPCWVMMRESGGNIHAYNPTGCGGRGCYGKWQCDPLSCRGTGSEAEQDAEARALWDHGRGCGNWGAC